MYNLEIATRPCLSKKKKEYRFNFLVFLYLTRIECFHINKLTFWELMRFANILYLLKRKLVSKREAIKLIIN